MVFTSRLRTHWQFGAILALALLLVACSNSSVVTGGTSTPTTGTATSGPAPASTSSPSGDGATCNSLIAVKNSSMPSNIMFPAGTILATPAVTAMGEASFVVQSTIGCAANSDTNLTISGGHGNVAFLSALFFSGWKTSGKFPFDGQLEKDCGSVPCFVYNANPAEPEYLAVDQVTNHGSGVISFRLRTALPPTAPSCPSSFPSAYYYTLNPSSSSTDIYGNIHFPPLTRIQGDSSAGHIGVDICSPGALSDVTAFFDAQLHAQGWAPTDASGDWANGSHTLYVLPGSFNSTYDTTTWALTYPKS